MKRMIYKLLHSKPIRLDLASLVVGIIVEIVILVRFTNFHTGVQKHCFLFGQLKEVKRIFIPGPSLVCSGQIYYSSFVIFALLVMSLMIACGHDFLFRRMIFKVMATLYTIFAVVDTIILWKGLAEFCKSIVSSTECSNDVLRLTDFRAYTPKYMKAWGAYAVLSLCMRLSIMAFFLWLTFLLTHFLHYQLQNNISGSSSECSDASAKKNNIGKAQLKNNLKIQRFHVDR